MFLDAWLKLGIFFGPIILLAILIFGLMYPVVLFRLFVACRRLLREGETEQFWLTAALMILVTVPVVALII